MLEDYGSHLPEEGVSRLTYAEHPGALLCGVDGLVMKCHGEGNPLSLQRSILEAERLIRAGFLDGLRTELQKLPSLAASQC
jgi:fatty acid/phospholipid biosynthesis enzyme